LLLASDPYRDCRSTGAGAKYDNASRETTGKPPALSRQHSAADERQVQAHLSSKRTKAEAWLRDSYDPR